MSPRFEPQSETAFFVNGWLVDLTLIEHWSQSQGGAKFHGIRTALAILRDFAQNRSRQNDDLNGPKQVERVLTALWRLAEFGYYVPPQVFDEGR